MAQCLLQIGVGERKFFHADQVQALGVTLRMLPAIVDKGLPGGQHIQTGAKAGFGHHKQRAIMVNPALGQAIMAKKHVTGFGQTVVIGKVNIVERSGDRRALVIPVQTRGCNEVG